jgi:hypothetical protein
MIRAIKIHRTVRVRAKGKLSYKSSLWFTPEPEQKKIDVKGAFDVEKKNFLKLIHHPNAKPTR